MSTIPAKPRKVKTPAAPVRPPLTPQHLDSLRDRLRVETCEKFADGPLRCEGSQHFLERLWDRALLGIAAARTYAEQREGVHQTRHLVGTCWLDTSMTKTNTVQFAMLQEYNRAMRDITALISDALIAEFYRVGPTPSGT